MSNQRWVTFDCYGTLVDWHSGFAAIMRPLAGPKTNDLLRAYHQCEREIQAEPPYRLYKDVLTIALARAARQAGVELAESEACALPEQWASLPVFNDIHDALAGLRSANWKLAVLTNCDEDLFAQTQRSFRLPFDRVVTSERVQDYKPSLAHFRFFEQATRDGRTDWVHVACSWFHDIAPARELGIKRIWLDRERTGEDPAAASLRLFTARDLSAAVQQLCDRSC
jgi:2-haloacid dehalogenase